MCGWWPNGWPRCAKSRWRIWQQRGGKMPERSLNYRIDFIGNRELEEPGTLWVSLKIFLVGCRWTAPKGHPAATCTPLKGDSWGPAAPKSPRLLLLIKSNTQFLE